MRLDGNREANCLISAMCVQMSGEKSHKSPIPLWDGTIWWRLLELMETNLLMIWKVDVTWCRSIWRAWSGVGGCYVGWLLANKVICLSCKKINEKVWDTFCSPGNKPTNQPTNVAARVFNILLAAVLIFLLQVSSECIWQLVLCDSLRIHPALTNWWRSYMRAASVLTA